MKFEGLCLFRMWRAYPGPAKFGKNKNAAVFEDDID
jgi:hypothetical protein